MNWIEALILGIVQGLTEFLPVSSSGHLEIGNVLLGIQGSDNLLFAVVVHAATALSTIVVFRNDLIWMGKELLKPQWTDTHQYVLKIIMSMVPVGIVGVFYADEVETFFSGNMLLVGSMLLITALLLLLSQWKKPGQQEVSYFSAFLIGIAQAFAVLPGISRSGATIATALMLGVGKSQAARFSFLMVLVPIFGASLLKLKDYFESPSVSNDISVTVLIVGFLAAFISGYLACSWMISIVKKGKLSYFAVYCIVVGIIAILSPYF